MKKMKRFYTGLILTAALTGCTASSAAASTETQVQESSAEIEQETVTETTQEQASVNTEETASSAITTTVSAYADGILDTSDLFTERDLTQTADLSNAVQYTVQDGQDITISEEGVYVISGTASEVTITVDAVDDAKVQIVLDGVSITNTDAPCIYVKNADKVFVTTTDSDNSLSVTGTFTADGETSTDAVIFSKDDLVLNGTGTLAITSTDNGISCKDDLKITGGTYSINSQSDAIEANDSILIADGNITIQSSKDGLHAENDEDNTTGYIYICGGTLNIDAYDDAIHATTVIQIDDGTLTLNSGEGIEATSIQINGGDIDISASDDGINAGRKSNAYTVGIEINDGNITIVMGNGDTDAIDANGNIYINGGTIDITANSPFDYDGTAQYNGGTIIVNGQEINTITNQMMGGGMMGGQMQGGQMPGGQMPNGNMQGGHHGGWH